MIRTFVYPQDLPAVLEIWQNAGPGVDLGRSDSEAQLRNKLKRDPELFLVAEESGTIVGAVLGGYDGRRGIIYHLAVIPEARRNGIGNKLMDELECRLRALGCIRSYLLVKYGNEDARMFYQRRGWEEMQIHIYGKNL